MFGSTEHFWTRALVPVQIFDLEVSFCHKSDAAVAIDKRRFALLPPTINSPAFTMPDKTSWLMQMINSDSISK